ncbi:MAG: SLOG family protein [Candidatus Coproplasma sp.]
MRKENCCAFTGHRKIKGDLDINDLDITIKKLIDGGVTTFYNGMARGFDLLAAQCVLKFKREYPQIKLVACVPCPEQDKYFSLEEKRIYHSVIEKCDEVKLISKKYHSGCMYERNRFMVDNCAHLIAYYRGEEGGTEYTLNYASSFEDEVKIYLV